MTTFLYLSALFLGLCVSFFASRVAAAVVEHCCEGERHEN
jgi:hypothetical protein